MRNHKLRVINEDNHHSFQSLRMSLSKQTKLLAVSDLSDYCTHRVDSDPF